ncbi:MFS multidrug transporter-like protein [Xylogone sp. PMI_703]|nr:MFS multidrug transporter-like protein [Xylogone sp. PMI_703]
MVESLKVFSVEELGAFGFEFDFDFQMLLDLLKYNPTQLQVIGRNLINNQETVQPQDQMDQGEECGPTELREEVITEQDAESASKPNGEGSDADLNLVTWEGPNDPSNPTNWSYPRKWAATLIVSSFTFISPVSSTMVAPALGAIATEFNISNDIEKQLTLSIFVLAYAIGPLILAPLSEIYGRVIVLQLANLVFLVFNLACGFSQSKAQMIAFRFMSGIGGSAPLAVGSGVLSDCWPPDERGRSISIYSVGPILGPAIGPIAGGFITENTTWRWAFYAVSICDAVIQVLGLFFLQETYAPKLLRQKAQNLRKATGNNSLHTKFDYLDVSSKRFLWKSICRPFKLLGTQLIVQVLALYMALTYGIMYLVLSTFPALWSDVYHESVSIGGLNYISLCVGFILGTQICAPFNDKLYTTLKKRNNGVAEPEFRIPLMIPGAILIPVGLLWYGWSAEHKLHWIMPNIGTAIFGAGMIIGFQCIQTYIVDCYSSYAASAIAAATVLRSLAGCGFPLFAPYLYKALNYGWGNTLLAFIAVGLGWPAPFLFWRYGAKLRERSTFAADLST